MTNGDAVDPDILFTETPEFIELHDVVLKLQAAVQKGQPTVELPAALAHRFIVLNNALDLPFYRDVYNRLCDELGRPDLKKPVDQSSGEVEF